MNNYFAILQLKEKVRLNMRDNEDEVQILPLPSTSSGEIGPRKVSSQAIYFDCFNSANSHCR